MYQHIQVPAGGQKITVNADFSLKVPDQPIIPFIEGDGTGVDITALREPWNALVNETLTEATLTRHDQPHQGYVAQGHVGVHSEHLGFLLAEMQSLARAHPTAVW